MPDYKGFKLQLLVNFQKFSTLRVKGTVSLCLKNQSTGDMKVIGYSDSKFASDMDDRHSTMGNIFTGANWLIG